MKNDLKQKIKEMNKSQLSKRLEEINGQILDNKMKLNLGSLKNVHANKELKKERAFINLLLSQSQEKAEAETKQKVKGK